MSLPAAVHSCLVKLGVDEAGLALVERETLKALTMTSAELTQEVETKSVAINYLRIQQAIYLAVLDSRKGV